MRTKLTIRLSLALTMVVIIAFGLFWAGMYAAGSVGFWQRLAIALALSVALGEAVLVGEIMAILASRRRRNHILSKILDTMSTVESALAVMARELTLETVFDETARERLYEAAQRCQILISSAREAVTLQGGREYAPEVLTLLVIAHDTYQALVIETLLLQPLATTNKTEIRRRIDRAAYGVNWVARLLAQWRHFLCEEPGHPIRRVTRHKLSG